MILVLSRPRSHNPPQDKIHRDIFQATRPDTTKFESLPPPEYSGADRIHRFFINEIICKMKPSVVIAALAVVTSAELSTRHRYSSSGTAGPSSLFELTIANPNGVVVPHLLPSLAERSWSPLPHTRPRAYGRRPSSSSSQLPKVRKPTSQRKHAAQSLPPNSQPPSSSSLPYTTPRNAGLPRLTIFQMLVPRTRCIARDLHLLF